MNSKTYLFNFEKLTVWQDARKFTSGIYNVTDKFPDREKFGLSSQIQRSAVSIAANIAEGSGQKSKKEFARYIEISYGSLMETLSHAYVAFDRNYVNQEKLDEIREYVLMLANKLNSLNNTLK
jgi:four helix bundle protein